MEGHHIFQQLDGGGSSKIIVEVRGVSHIFRAKGSVKLVILCSVLDGNISLMNIILEILFSFNHQHF